MTETPSVLRPAPGKWQRLTLFLTALVVVGLNIGYTSWVQHQAEQRSAEQRRVTGLVLCALAAGVDPSTADAKTLELAAKVRAAFHC